MKLNKNKIIKNPPRHCIGILKRDKKEEAILN
jgi:hypothetical protein